VLILIALIIAIVNLAFVPASIRLPDGRMIAFALVAALAGIAYISLFFVGNTIHRSQKLAVGRLITTQWLNTLFKSKRLFASDVGSLRNYARMLLEIPVDDSEPPPQLAQRLAKEVGLNVPDGFDFSEVEKPVE